MVYRLVKGYFNNWTDPQWTLSEKLQMSAKNAAIKARKRATCCGNHGEPGC